MSVYEQDIRADFIKKIKGSRKPANLRIECLMPKIKEIFSDDNINHEEVINQIVERPNNNRSKRFRIENNSDPRSFDQVLSALMDKIENKEINYQSMRYGNV